MSKSKSTDFIRRIGRVQPKINPDQGPGTYEASKVFGAELGKVTIGSKCEFKLPQTPGPCDYSPERGDSLTKSTSKATIFKASPSRPLLKCDSQIGPGSYDRSNNFGDSLGRKTIGVKRMEKISSGVGPGQYSPQKLSSRKSIEFPKTQRFKSIIDANNGPGSYEPKNLQTPKKMKIGERR